MIVFELLSASIAIFSRDLELMLPFLGQNSGPAALAGFHAGDIFGQPTSEAPVSEVESGVELGVGRTQQKKAREISH